MDATDPVIALGERIRRARRASGMTQAHLAREAGVGRSFLVELEHGHARAELGKTLAVLGQLGLTLTPPVAETVELTCSERTEALADVLEDWEHGTSVPDEDTRRIVQDYLAGRIGVDEAIERVDALPTPV